IPLDLRDQRLRELRDGERRRVDLPHAVEGMGGVAPLHVGTGAEVATGAGEDHGADGVVVLERTERLTQRPPCFDRHRVLALWSAQRDRGDRAVLRDQHVRHSYSPFQTGASFSANARAPSLASADAKTGSMNLRCATKASGSV